MKNSAKKIISLVLCFVFVFSLLPLNTAAESTGLEIGTPDEMRQFADRVNAGETFEGQTVILTANIDLGGEENPWTPIGSKSAQFKGTFDGGYHIISGLYVSGTTYSGLFGNVKGGMVKNIVVEGKVSGTSNVAGVVAYLDGGKIENCGNRADISGGSAVGGVAGYLNGACTVSSCFNTGSVSGSTGYIGGVTGQHWRAGEVDGCYNTGSVSGPASVGGISGGHKASSPVIANCFNAGNVSGSGSNVEAVLGAGRSSTTNCFYIEGTGSDSKGSTAVSSFSEASLSEYFTEKNGRPSFLWESKIDASAPVTAAFTEKTELSAKLAEYIKAAFYAAKTEAGVSGTLLGDENYKSGASSTGTDWLALAMGRFGLIKEDGSVFHITDDGTGYDNYLAAMKTYIETTYANNNGILHRIKATEWHRAAVTVAALGGDVTKVGKYNGNDIDLIADGSYDCVIAAGPGAQGINGWIWGLISLDAQRTEVPENAKYTRERFITEILKMQLADGVGTNKYGGWVLGGYGSSSDVDITAMAIQSLAPYYTDDTAYTYENQNTGETLTKTVRECIDEALDRLGRMMNENGGFVSWNTENSESIAQVIVALTAVGIDPATDSRFISSTGKTLLDGLLRFRLSSGGFSHILSSGFNSMANDQATYALVSYWRFENGLRSLYDMVPEMTKDSAEKTEAATKAISEIPEPGAADFKEKIKIALTAYESIEKADRRYIKNHTLLSSYLELIGGKENLDNDERYLISISVVSSPDKTTYYENEYFDKTGLVIKGFYSDGNSVEITDYTLSQNRAFSLGTTSVTAVYGIFSVEIPVTVLEIMPWDGNGTEESPYIIKTAEDLENLGTKVNGGHMFTGVYFKMAADIDMADFPDRLPIGSSSSRQFDGIFDGGGYSIYNLTSKRGGLFGYVCKYAVIKNVTIASGEIGSSNLSFMGAVANWSNGADFINCKNAATVYGSGYSGGIVGTVRDGGESVISGCVNTGNIYGRDTAVGGIVGHLDTSRQSTSVNVMIENCYNRGEISGRSAVGGIAGKLQDGHKIINCYNIGKANAGVVDEMTSDNIVENSYYNSEVSGGDTGTAKTPDEMKTEKFLSLLGSSFKKDRYDLENGGYPLLYWEKTEDADNIDEVISAIENLDGEESLIYARARFNSLPEGLKLYITNLEKLENAETELAEKKELENAKNEALEELKKYGNVSERLLAAAREEIAAATTKEEVAAALEKVRNAVPATPETKPEVKPENPGTSDSLLPFTATVAVLSVAAAALLIKKKKEI